MEITRNYPDAGDLRAGWKIEKFDFKPPSDNGTDTLKPRATFELELKNMPQFDKCEAGISETTPKSDTKTTKVGTSANKQGKLGGTLLKIWHLLDQPGIARPLAVPEQTSLSN